MVSHDEQFRLFVEEKQKLRQLNSKPELIKPGFIEPRPNSTGNAQKSSLELYRSFMHSYVESINDATFKVTIGGVRIGSAKYSRLAQINLKTRVITFSRFAVENVPERARRYLVLHELAHVLEASHNRDYWNYVKIFEPEYKRVGKDLDNAFKENVRRHEKQAKENSDLISQPPAPFSTQALKQANLIWTPEFGYLEAGKHQHISHASQQSSFQRELDSSLLEEAFEAYVAMQDEEKGRGNLIFDVEMAQDHPGLYSTALNEPETIYTSCTDNEEEVDGDEEDTTETSFDPDFYFDDSLEDSFFGVITGGD